MATGVIVVRVRKATFAAPRWKYKGPLGSVRVPSGKIIKLLPLASDARASSIKSTALPLAMKPVRRR